MNRLGHRLLRKWLFSRAKQALLKSRAMKRRRRQHADIGTHSSKPTEPHLGSILGRFRDPKKGKASFLFKLGVYSGVPGRSSWGLPSLSEFNPARVQGSSCGGGFRVSLQVAFKSASLTERTPLRERLCYSVMAASWRCSPMYQLHHQFLSRLQTTRTWPKTTQPHRLSRVHRNHAETPNSSIRRNRRRATCGP